MKRIVILLSILVLLVSGCSIKTLSNTSISKNIDAILSDNTKLYNVNFEGYKYYVPRGLKFINKDNYNALLKDKYDNNYYLYVDVISYYHKVENSYKVNKRAFYSEKLDYNKKTGYIEINEVNNKYFVEFVFYYTKVEAYVSKEHLVDAISNICYLVKSVKYNDKVLESLVGENVLDYKEETFNIFDSNSDNEDFLDYVEEYDNNQKNSSDEDIFDIDEE